MEANLSAVATSPSATGTPVSTNNNSNHTTGTIHHHLHQIPKTGTPVKEDTPTSTSKNQRISSSSMSAAAAMAIPPAKQPKPKGRPAFDSIFDKYLDSDSFDLDFEEAYSMYNNLQFSNAINGIEQLEQVQLLNQQYVTNFNHQNGGMPPRNLANGKNMNVSNNVPVNGNIRQQFPLADSAYPDTSSEAHRYRHLGYAGHQDYLANRVDKSAFDAHRSQILSGNAAAAAAAAAAAMNNVDRPPVVNVKLNSNNGVTHSLSQDKNYLLGSPQLQTFTDLSHSDFKSMQAKKAAAAAAAAATTRTRQPEVAGDAVSANGNGAHILGNNTNLRTFESNEFAGSSGDATVVLTQPTHTNTEDDQFFSHMESNALEKFLDNLFDSNYQDPLSLYPSASNTKSMQRQFKELNNLYDLHTMKPQLQTMDAEAHKQYFASISKDVHGASIGNNYSADGTEVPDYTRDTYQLKRELTEVFAGTASDPLKPASGDSDHNKMQPSHSGSDSAVSENIQLQTPLQSRQSFSGLYGRDVVDVEGNAGVVSSVSKAQKRKLESTTNYADLNAAAAAAEAYNNADSSIDNENDEEDEDEDDDGTAPGGSRKKRKPSLKPLLSLEQKRLNHSHSEQKRRKLCKLAYERCLRLVINVDEYRKQAHTCNNTPSQLVNGKKSRRAMINKDGLPNLSKHTALMKISNEIMTLQELNRGLRKLLKESQ